MWSILDVHRPRWVVDSSFGVIYNHRLELRKACVSSPKTLYYRGFQTRWEHTWRMVSANRAASTNSVESASLTPSRVLPMCPFVSAISRYIWTCSVLNRRRSLSRTGNGLDSGKEQHTAFHWTNLEGVYTQFL